MFFVVLISLLVFSEAQDCTISDGYEYLFNDISTVNASDASACCDLCKEHAQCVVWTYNKANKACSLKHSDNIKVPATNKVSGLKEKIENLESFIGLVDTDFSDMSTKGWLLGDNKSPHIDRCGTSYVLGGVNRLGVGSKMIWKAKTPWPTQKVKVWFRFAYIDSWDGEEASMLINGEKAWSDHHRFSSGPNICGHQWEDTLKFYEVTWELKQETTNLSIEFSTRLDQDANDESWGIAYFKVAFTPNLKSLPGEVHITTLNGQSIEIYLLGSDVNDDVLDSRIISLPELGKLEEVSNGKTVTIRSAPYEVEHNMHSVKYHPSIMSSVVFDNDPYTTQLRDQFQFEVISKNKTVMKIVSVNITIQAYKLKKFTTNDIISIGEIQLLSNLNQVSRRIPFRNRYINPVVIAEPLSHNGGDTAVSRITSVNSDSYTILVQEPPDLDGKSLFETASSMVLEAGSYVLSDGTRVEVGKVVTSATWGAQVQEASWKNVNFPSSTTFKKTPIVFTQVQTSNDAHWVKTRVSFISTRGFSISLEEENENEVTHGGEIVGYVAIEPAQGNWTDKLYEVNNTPTQIKDSWYTINFQNTYLNKPLFFSALQTSNHPESIHLRYNDLKESHVKLRWERDFQSKSNIQATAETAGYIAIEPGSGELNAYPAERFSQPTVFNIERECYEGNYEYIQLLTDNADPDLYATILDLPIKGALYQFSINTISDANLIIERNTRVRDSLGRVIYHPYKTDTGAHGDYFTFKATKNGLDSNVATATFVIQEYVDWGWQDTGDIIEPIIPPDFIPTSNSDGTLIALLVLALVLIAIMLIILSVIGFFLYKKKHVREEMVQLFLGNTNNEGETTYFPDTLEDNEI